MDIKDNSVEGLGKKEESHRESLYNFREYIYYYEEIWTLKAFFLVRFQMEMSNRLLETGGKVILDIKQVWTCLNSVLLL